MRARRTAREVASPAAQDLREPALGEWRYVRRDCPSTQAWERASMIWSLVPPRRRVATAVEATLTRTTWSSPTRLKEFLMARTPWISWAWIMAWRASRIVRGLPWRER